MSPTYQVFGGLLSSYLGLGMVLPVVAPLVRELGLTEFQGNLVFALHYLMWVLAGPLWGLGSDRWGRKPVILLGLAGFTVSHLLFAVTADLGLQHHLQGVGLLGALVLTKAFAGAAFSAAPPACQAYVVDQTSPRERVAAVGLLGAAAGLGQVVGPAITAMLSLAKMPLSWSIYAAAAMPIIPVLLLWLFLPAGRRAPPAVRGAKKLRIDRIYNLGLLLGLGLALNMAVSLLLTTLGYYLQDRLQLDEHGTTWTSSVAMLLVGLVAVVVQLGLLRVLSWTAVTLLRVGLAIMSVGTMLLVFTQSELAIYGACMVVGLGYSFAYPGFQTTITYAVEEHEQGSAAGLAAATGALAFAIGPLAGAGLYQATPEAPFVASALALAVGAALALLHPRMRRLRQIAKGDVPA